MTTIPKPAGPTAAFYATYDAWSRLVKVEQDDGIIGTWTVAEYEYDGAKRRSIKEFYAFGVLDKTRHFFYTEPRKWQVVEERIDNSSAAERQFVWGLRYVDDLVLRDRDTNGDGTLDERLYGMQDANWNVIALGDVSGYATERYRYDAYGDVTFMDGSFGSRTVSSFDNSYAFTGRRRDSEAGIYYYRNRYYDGIMGCFISRDPIGYHGSQWDLYEYCNSQPCAKVDPTGLVIGGGGLAVCNPLVGAGAVGLGVGCVAYQCVTKPLLEPVLIKVCYDITDICRRPKKKRWRCTAKPRGNCPGECQAPFEGLGSSYDEAYANAFNACVTAGCHTPGGNPSCNCGHVTCFQSPN